MKLYSLLIVPYGIETRGQLVSSQRCCLLIVPYGIETVYLYSRNKYRFPFNRTLWN